jgi:hypothetical protein
VHSPRFPLKNRRSHAIVDASDATLASTVGTAVHLAVGLDAMADDAAPAMDTLRGELMDRTLEAVEGVTTVPEQDVKALVVVITADFALGHVFLISLFAPAGARAEPARRARERPERWGAESLHVDVRGFTIPTACLRRARSSANAPVWRFAQNRTSSQRSRWKTVTSTDTLARIGE